MMGPINPGDRVRHGGTKQWGKVLRVVKMHYGTELFVERIQRTDHDFAGEGQWEQCRIDRHEPAAAAVEITDYTTKLPPVGSR